MATRLTHRLTKLEAALPKPKPECYCGIERLKDGNGPVRPGWILPYDRIEDPEFMTIGCKSCLAWVKFKTLPEPQEDGIYHIVGGICCSWPPFM